MLSVYPFSFEDSNFSFGYGLNMLLIIKVLTLSQTTNFRPFQTDSLQTTILSFYENGRKLSKQKENTEESGEIARHAQLLLSPQYFQKTYTADT